MAHITHPAAERSSWPLAVAATLLRSLAASAVTSLPARPIPPRAVLLRDAGLTTSDAERDHLLATGRPGELEIAESGDGRAVPWSRPLREGALLLV